jgi:leucine dehydrogenase
MKIEEIKVADYEKVVHAQDPHSGLNAFIAVHSTVLGPALGGMRMWPYGSPDEALTDVLRLSMGMTYKSAIARTGLGGGKSVIIGDPKTVKTPKLLQAMGSFIDTLGGRYMTAEDVNIGVSDLKEVRKTTRWVTGLPREEGSSGNPSPYTALGVFLGIQVCLDEVFGSRSMAGKRIAVQGAGSVASGVIDQLVAGGAHVTVCDINEERLATLRKKHPQLVIVPADAIFDVDCDVFSPHALGAILNDQSLPRLRCKIVAGAANNQLAEPRHGDVLRARGILYAPDFVINAGGIINVGCELEPGGYDEKKALAKIQNIEPALREVFQESRDRGISTGEAAVHVAQRIIAAAKAKN